MPYERKTSDIFVSDELKKILTEIESQSMVAALLLKKRHSNEDLAEDFVNYISVSLQDKGKISYLTKERAASMDESEYWSSSRRFQAKPGGFISKVFKNIPAKEVEIFSTLFRNVSNRIEVNLRVVKGERIRDFYYYESYANDGGSLGASCMRYDNCQKYMDIYVDNPGIVSMLVMIDDNGSLLGRALLWDFDGYKVMDRIYTVNDEKLAFYFKEWATKNNYLFKSNQNWFDTMNFERIGDKRQQLKIAIKLPNSEYRYYPYMDTFKFFDPNTGTISNYQPSGHFYTICTPDGSKYERDYLVLDVVDKVFRYRHDACYVRYLDGFTSGNNVKYSEISDEYILCEDAIYDEEIGDWIFNEENDQFNDSERIQRRREEIARRKEERARRDAERAARRAEEAQRADGGEEAPADRGAARHGLQELISRYIGSMDATSESGFLDLIDSFDLPRIRRRGRSEQQREGQQAPVDSPAPTSADVETEQFDDLPF